MAAEEITAGPGADRTSDQAGAAGSRRPSAVRRWLGRLISLVATLAVVGIAAVAVALTVVPALVGGSALTVLSGSMVPEFSPGAMVVDKPAPASSLRVGDVITYATTDEASGTPILITHRIVAIESSSAGPAFITKGDAIDAADDRPVEAAQIRGQVWYSVPYIGTARNFLLAQGAGLILGGAVGLVAAVWFLIHLLRSDPKPPQSGAGPAANPPEPRRHRARNGAMLTALAGLLVTSTHLATQPPGTFAQFSDQQTVGFQITMGSATPAP
jgi:signal peptidase